MPQPPRPRYTVYWTDAEGDHEHEVTITWGDQCRGELEQPRQGITNTMGANLSTLWAWCALVRMGVYSAKFKQFQLDECTGIDDHTEDGTEAPELDPTAPATS